MDAISIGTQGLLSAAQRFDASAVRTVTGQGDPVSETVAQISAKTEFQASAAVVRTGDQMLGALLDMKV